MTYGLISSFDSVTCGKAILSNGLGNQAFSFSVNGIALILYTKFFSKPCFHPIVAQDS